MSCTHGQDLATECVYCLREQLIKADAECERVAEELYATRGALGRVMRTIKVDVFHLDTWPKFEGDFLDGVCELLRDLGMEE